MRLLETAGAVVSVEIDPAFASLTNEAIESHYMLFATAREGQGTQREKVRLLHTDILERKNALNPKVLQTLHELLGQEGLQQLKLVANLPYSVAIPVISNLLLTDLPIERMVVMVQWELAERMLARAATKDYGALAVLVQSLTDVSLVRRLPPEVFWPRPQVDSAIMQIRPNPARRAHVGDAVRLRNFLRDLYVHRRKNLRGALASLPTGRRTKGEVDAKLEELGIEGSVRAEVLDLEQHLRLCRAFG
jgi:16S rRNA (adenine1518-N6/adenine1519-N6)-dimethyltransferase